MILKEINKDQLRLLKLTKKYFEYFRNANINKLKDLFSDNIILTDWEIDIKEKKNVINQNILIFKNLKKFNLKIIKIDQINYKFFCQIEININQNNVVKILDIIEFNKKFMIKKIIAYKRWNERKTTFIYTYL